MMQDQDFIFCPNPWTGIFRLSFIVIKISISYRFPTRTKNIFIIVVGFGIFLVS